AALRSASEMPPEPDAASLFDPPANVESSGLRLSEVDEAFERITAMSGGGSNAARTQLLRELFRRASQAERDFLTRLVMGKLRQGALGGVMEDAVARASDLPLSEIRR